MIKTVGLNGIYLDVPAGNALSGYKSVLNLLSEYYSPVLSEQKYHLTCEAEHYSDKSGRLSWKHSITDSSEVSGKPSGTLGDIVIKHLGSYKRRTSQDRRESRRIDYAVSSAFAPGETMQKYWLFFNLADEFSSKNERDNFLSFARKEYL